MFVLGMFATKRVRYGGRGTPFWALSFQWFGVPHASDPSHAACGHRLPFVPFNTVWILTRKRMVWPRSATKKKITETLFLSVRYRVTRASTIAQVPGSENWGYLPTTVALIRGVPFFGFEPVVKLGVPPPYYRSLDKVYPFLALNW